MDKKLLLRSDNFYLATFPTTHHALHAEKVLEDGGIAFIVVPTPREISAGCGLSVRFFEQEYKMVQDIFQDKKVTSDEFYNFKNGHYYNIKPPVSEK